MICVLAALLLAGPLLFQPAATSAQDGAVYAPETGFWVDPLFAEYWERNGGLMTFGYPISRVFYQDGLHLQYFERAIFEHHENEAGDWKVMLVRLGALNTTERRQDVTDTPFVYRAADPVLDEGGVYFSETGHALSATFRDYWERHGGVQTFGYPLSDEFLEPSIEDGVLRPVQYFERARFEWHDEFAGSVFEVLLGHLGREALAARDVPPLALTPQTMTDTARDAPPLGPLPVGGSTPVSCGFNLAFYGHDDSVNFNEFYVDAAAESGCEWLRLQFTWRDMQPNEGQPVAWTIWPYLRVVEMATERGLKVLVNIAHPPDWARPLNKRSPAKPEAFGAFTEELVTLMAGKVDAWQLWNEPNLIGETNGYIDPAGFLPLLRAGHAAVKSADPDALVVSPGLAPNS
ncbi:MAG: cellulase family glycosylhydrolase, partial [Chloroflexota bacterium]|nr:cellulase family glycosylhydrolase [Chloroflexota bacterium]